MVDTLKGDPGQALRQTSSRSERAHQNAAAPEAHTQPNGGIAGTRTFGQVKQVVKRTTTHGTHEDSVGFASPMICIQPDELTPARTVRTPEERSQREGRL